MENEYENQQEHDMRLMEALSVGYRVYSRYLAIAALGRILLVISLWSTILFLAKASVELAIAAQFFLTVYLIVEAGTYLQKRRLATLALNKS